MFWLNFNKWWIEEAECFTTKNVSRSKSKIYGINIKSKIYGNADAHDAQYSTHSHQVLLHTAGCATIVQFQWRGVALRDYISPLLFAVTVLLLFAGFGEASQAISTVCLPLTQNVSA